MRRGGWDSHINNHEIHKNLVKILDPAFAALVRDLRRRGLLEHALVLCGEGADSDLLASEGVAEMDGFVSVSGREERA